MTKKFCVYTAAVCTAAAVLFSLVSCGQSFLRDPRLYNTADRNMSPGKPPEEPGIGPVEGVDPFDDLTKWYNKPDIGNGDGSYVDYSISFPASEFDNILLSAWFDNANVAYYSMGPGGWNVSNAANNEYSYSGPNTTGQGWNITGVNYYLYKSINPCYDAAGNYNTALQTTEAGNPKLNRFYFYRFTGRGGGIVNLDNYLIAVDTYSKLVFAFAKPVKFSAMGAPTEWEAVDAEPYADGKSYPFYEYDPVGYVTKDGDGQYTVQIYEWFRNALGSGNYDAQMGRTAEVTKTPDGAGKSPFNSRTEEPFSSNMKNLSGKPFQRRDGLMLYTYVISEDGETITRTEQEYKKPASSEEKTFTYVSHSSSTEGVFASDDGPYDFALTDNMKTIQLTAGDGTVVKAVLDFADPGPDFLLRVAGKTYRAQSDQSRTYTFSADGQTLTDSKNGIEYTFTQQDSTTRAVYKKQKYQFGDLGSYFGLRLGPGSDNSVDNDGTVLYWSSGNGWLTPGITPTQGASSSPADLVE